MANETIYVSGSSNDYGSHYEEAGWYHTGYCRFGYWSDSGVNSHVHGAIRFLNINIVKNTSVNFAKLMFRIDSYNGSGIYWNVQGIDEDNTANFSSDPYSRAKTTASTTGYWGSPSANTWVEIDVRDIVNEILARNGWSSGNAMGFFLQDNGTAHAQNNVRDDYANGDDSYLAIRVSAEPDFTPTPITISAPTFPAADDYGIKISKPGVDVKTATEAQLYFTSKKKCLKVKAEADTAVTGGVLKTIAHGLTYAPLVLGYVKSVTGTYRMKLNRYFDGATDPIAGGVQGYISSNATNIKIVLNKSTDVYYYSIIDPLEE